MVLLGHTLDDQAEQVLLGLLRGSGSRSLSGMPPRRGRYARPFLALRRAETRAACRERGLTWWEDPHNADPVSYTHLDVYKRQAQALAAFATALRAAGVTVKVAGSAAPPAPGQEVLGSVASAPVREQLGLALLESDNGLTESLARACLLYTSRCV